MRAVLLIVALGAAPAVGFAQPSSPTARGDVALATGLLSTKHPELPPYDRWDASTFADVSGGLYWTDHLKTEVELLWSNDATSHGSDPSVVPGGHVYVTRRFQNTVFSAGQSYQFGRNAFFHPFATAGISVDRARASVERPAQDVYFPPPGRPMLVPADLRSERRVRARAYAATGFKAYFAERGFFRTDLKLAFRSGVEQVTWKVAVGVDF